jgi:hypothetical protein
VKARGAEPVSTLAASSLSLGLFNCIASLQVYCFSKNDERACSLPGYLRGRPVYVPRGHAPSADGFFIDWRDIITKPTRLDGPCNSSIRETCAVLSGTRSSPNVPAPLGYAPCYVANLAAPSFGNRDEKVIATLTWHFLWQRPRLKNHLEAPLKPSCGFSLSLAACPT